MTGLLSLALPIPPCPRGWSVIGTYGRTLLIMIAIFAWAPIWIVLGGQRSLLGFPGQVQFSGLLVFLTAPLGAIPVAWYLRRAPSGAVGLPGVFVLLKIALVIVTAAIFYLVTSAAPSGTFSVRNTSLSRTLAFLMVGLPLSVPFGIAYGLAFQALFGLWAGRDGRAEASADR